jgi:hypothetical protein
MVAVVDEFVGEMVARFDRKRSGADPDTFTRRLLVIDEMADFAGAVKDAWTVSRPKGAAGQPPTLLALKRVLRQSRAARMHVIGGAQQPNADVVAGTEGRAQFGLKIAAGKLDGPLSEMMFGTGQPPAVEDIRGRAVVEIDGQFEPVQLAYLDARRAAEMAAAGSARFPARPVPTQPAAAPAAAAAPPPPVEPAVPDPQVCAVPGGAGEPPPRHTLTHETHADGPPMALPDTQHTLGHTSAAELSCYRCAFVWRSAAKPGSSIGCPSCGHRRRVPAARY